MAIVVLVLLGASGCSSGEGTPEGGIGPGHMESRMAHRAQMRQMRHRAMMRRRAQAKRERHQAMMRRRHRRMIRQRAAMRQLRAEEAERRAAEEAEAEEASTEESSECDPNYAGACLDPYASDYDCADGSGNGPDYTGTVTVVGEDHYGLDADGDGTGCESE